MTAPRTFQVRQVMLQIGRPMSAPELAPLVGMTARQAHGAIENLILHDLARRVIVAGRPKYEAAAA